MFVDIVKWIYYTSSSSSSLACIFLAVEAAAEITYKHKSWRQVELLKNEIWHVIYYRSQPSRQFKPATFCKSVAYTYNSTITSKREKYTAPFSVPWWRWREVERKRVPTMKNTKHTKKCAAQQWMLDTMLSTTIGWLLILS